jgi:hypothetical protein
VSSLTSSSMGITVVVAEDAFIVREGVRMLLEEAATT